MKNNDLTTFFWKISERFLKQKSVSRGTMMGFPCLRVEGDFFASADHRTGDLIIKLSAERVQALIDEGVGQDFAPAGRKFREWVLIADRDTDSWDALMQEALDFVRDKA